MYTIYTVGSTKTLVLLLRVAMDQPRCMMISNALKNFPIQSADSYRRRLIEVPLYSTNTEGFGEPIVFEGVNQLFFERLSMFCRSE